MTVELSSCLGVLMTYLVTCPKPGMSIFNGDPL